MVRKATRRSTRTTPRTKSAKTTRKTQRAFDPKRLPHAAEVETLGDIFDFFTERLPHFVEQEFERLEIARSESEMFRALASLPDSMLRKAGLRREELPRFVLSVFHLIEVSKRGGKARRPTGRRATRRPTTRRRAPKSAA